MPRIAGNDSHYTFSLGDYSFRLPSVTSILEATFAKPALVGWAYKVGILGVKEVASDLVIDGELEALYGMDYDELKRQIHSRGLSTKAIGDKSKKRGSVAHDVLESLALGTVTPDDIWDATISPEAKPYVEGVVKWWKDAGSQWFIDGTERPVWSLKNGYAGTLDLIGTVEGLTTSDNVEHRRIWDLKTSSGIYPDHVIQLGAYKLAWEEMFPDQPIHSCSILRVGDDGTYEERTVDPDPKIFLHLKAVYDYLKGNR